MNRARRSAARLGSVALFAALALATSAPAQQQGLPAFSEVAPETVGVPAQGLEALAGVVQGWVDADEIVGAELLVIKNDQRVLHRAFGWKHREEKVALERDSIFCVRSMTKPVAGTAVQLLIDGHKLDLADRASKYLAAFDNDRAREITVGQLLQHQGGLALSSLLDARLSSLTSLGDVAKLVGERGPEFPLGEYRYSDDGVDTLGAIVEAITKKRLDEFLAERLCVPLGMRDTLGVVSDGHALRSRVVSNYSGTKGAWVRYWSPTQAPIFPVLLASQGLYTTPLDYARFLHLWKERGRVGGERLLSTRAVQRALEPGVATRFPTTFEGLEVHYGQLMMLWIDPKRLASDQLVAFGHGGSDGTHAWVWPELDLMVLYFTQSRGNTTGIAIEALLQKHLIDPLIGTLRAPPITYTDAELDALAGLYWDDDSGLFRTIARKGGGLALEFLGQAELELTPTSTRDRWTVRLVSGHLDAERSESGAIKGLVLATARETERWPRWTPAADLPPLADVHALRQRAVDWTRLGELGGVRLSGTCEFPDSGMKGTFVQLVHGRERCRSDLEFGSYHETTVLDGKRGWVAGSREPATEVEGARLEQLRLDHPFAPVADWRGAFRELTVIARTKFKGTNVVLVRAVPEQARVRAYAIAAETGLLHGEATIVPVVGLGELGVATQYRDWREVGGIRLPFEIVSQYASPALGRFVMRVEKVELGVKFAADTFAPLTK